MPTSPHDTEPPPLRRLSTPRAAASAGVVFAVLLATTMILIRIRMPGDAADSARWLHSQHGTITTATVLMPFAGISFLWFIGVVRDGFGPGEDRFFLTIFLGSGLLFLAMMFVATAVAAGLLFGNTGVVDSAAHAEVVGFGRTIIVSASQTYALRMGAVFMISLGTIWLRTGWMPRWLAGLTYLMAVAMLIGAEVSRWTTLAFPAWVLVVSVLLLVRCGRNAALESGSHTP
ncbi:hypothetical protein [Nocardia vaccinii]|uniref:hypothetical protein n=1 Tax=Nocardia vaccinii TaxID=1822 RepID=UPI00082E4CA2|nr:hypothetical protein [Nocardia vaccinii]